MSNTARSLRILSHPGHGNLKRLSHTLRHGTENVPSKADGKEMEQTDMRNALKTPAAIPAGPKKKKTQ